MMPTIDDADATIVPAVDLAAGAYPSVVGAK
jgi:hypothetical protein